MRPLNLRQQRASVSPRHAVSSVLGQQRPADLSTNTASQYAQVQAAQHADSTAVQGSLAATKGGLPGSPSKTLRMQSWEQQGSAQQQQQQHQQHHAYQDPEQPDAGEVPSSSAAGRGWDDSARANAGGDTNNIPAKLRLLQYGTMLPMQLQDINQDEVDAMSEGSTEGDRTARLHTQVSIQRSRSNVCLESTPCPYMHAGTLLCSCPMLRLVSIS